MTPKQRAAVLKVLESYSTPDGYVPRGTFFEIARQVGVPGAQVSRFANYHGYYAKTGKSEKIKALLPAYMHLPPAKVCDELTRRVRCSRSLVEQLYYKEKRKLRNSSGLVDSHNSNGEEDSDKPFLSGHAEMIDQGSR